MPAAEVTIDPSLVRALLRELGGQHPAAFVALSLP